MTPKNTHLPTREQASEVIRDLHLARFIRSALRNASMSLGQCYLRADIQGHRIEWEETAAYPLLGLLPKLQYLSFPHYVCDAKTLQAYDDFFKSKVIDYIESLALPRDLKAKWLPEILVNCQAFAAKGRLPFISGNNLKPTTLYSVDEQVADAYTVLKTYKLRFLRVHFAVARAFTLKAIELFTIRIQELHQRKNTTKFFYFESFKELAPLLDVSNAVYEHKADKDIVSIDALNDYLAQIRRQFSLTDGLSLKSEALCIQLLEQCLSNAAKSGVSAFNETNPNALR